MKKSLLVFIIGVLFLCTNAFASQSAKFHSSFIYHFAKYIEWPENMQKGDFVVAVVGQNDISAYLYKLAQVRKVGVQKIVIKKCNSIAEAKGAHIIFLSDTHLSSFSQAVKLAKTENSLLITDEENYARKGSMINFSDKNGKMEFELNKQNFDSAQLKVSQQLLKLAILI